MAGGSPRGKHILIVVGVLCVGVQLGLYKILVHYIAFATEPIIIDLPPPTCNTYIVAIVLHDYCAIYAPVLTPLLYAIHHTILAMAISCKGQGAAGATLIIATLQ